MFDATCFIAVCITALVKAGSPPPHNIIQIYLPLPTKIIFRFSFYLMLIVVSVFAYVAFCLCFFEITFN